MKIRRVSREARVEELHDGQCGDAKAHEVEAQEPPGFGPRVPPQAVVRGLRRYLGEVFGRLEDSEGEPDRGSAPDAGSCAY